jgi:hypothetical protein
MSDYFGPGQPRVLNVSDRSLDQVVFQNSTPPLTSEWNLINQICDLKSQENLKINQPSGWLKVGIIADTGATDSGTEIIAEQNARSGQVLTSITYNPNQFKLVSRELTNVAVVNGWPIIVQKPATLPLIPAGDNDINTNIAMTLPPVSSVYRYDIVFLEVWKKLVSYTDLIYPYGNVQAIPIADNEIMWDVIGAETTKRIQIQYRVRTYPSESYNNPIDPDMFPEGLGWSNVKPVGGRDDGDYVTDLNVYFKSAGHRDIGLYIAGDGSVAHQELLNTVDGYVYAIPMFMVYRRGAGFPFTPNSVHTSISVLGDDGSDRPDGKYADVVYADDIIDLRHQLITSGKDLESALKGSFRKLVTNELNTSLNKGFTTSNQRIVCSGGSNQLKIDQLNGSISSIPNIGDGCLTTEFKRRAYCNADLISDHNVFQVPTNGTGPAVGTWVEGTISVASFFSSTAGEIESIDGLYFINSSTSWGNVTDCDISSPLEIEIGAASNILGTSYNVFIEFTFKYTAQKYGFYDVPKKFYEVDKGVYLPIATRDQTVSVRYDNNHSLISGTVSDYLKYSGGNYTENYEFGHDYIYYLYTTFSSFSIACLGDKFNGYTILGIKSIQVKSGSVYGNPVAFTVQRSVSGLDVTYIVTTSITVPADILITFYTGSGSTEEESFKFFELSKQGRGIIDIYEMILVEATAISTGTYLVDTGDKPIIAIATYKSMASGYVIGKAFAYDDSGNLVDVKITPPGGGSPVPEVNNYLPVLNNSDDDDNFLPTRIILNTDVGFSSITIPILVHSYVTSTEEAYSFYYKFIPYQGLLLDSSVEKGKIEKEGPAVITTEGSGSINNLSFNLSDECDISINQGDRLATQSGENPWSNSIKAGDYLNISGSYYFYRILSVDSDTEITIAETFNEPSVISQPFIIVRLDVPKNNIANAIDVLPTYDSNDYMGLGLNIELGGLSGSVIETSSKISAQSPLDTIVNDFQLGLNKPSNSRGRSFFRLSDVVGKNEFVKLGVLTPYIKYGNLTSWPPENGYKKVYQAYLYNKAYYDNSSFYRDLTGRLYLLVVSSETNQDNTDIILNGFSDRDTIDIFELVGRPIIKTV